MYEQQQNQSQDAIQGSSCTSFLIHFYQGINARKVNCVCVYSAYILKPDLSRRTMQTRIDTFRLVSEEVKSI